MAKTTQKSASKVQSPVSGRQRTLPGRLGAAPGSFDMLASLQAAGGNRAVSGLLGGGPLPEDVREDMEMRFGESFADVRIHNDAPAHASAADLNAKAYTHGRDIVFSEQRFDPYGTQGKRLLAHELAHVVQQRRGGAAPELAANAPHEIAADAAAHAVVAGQSGIAVGGASGIGIARDEEESWTARLRRKATEIKESIPPEYREKMQKVGDFVADKTVDMVALPLGPIGMTATDGLGSAMLHGAQKVASGDADVGTGLRNLARDKAQEGLGTIKGVVTQLTEVVDTGMWVGNEYKGLRDKAAKAVGGEEGSRGNEAVKQFVDATARLLPGAQILPQMADASDNAKKAGLVDKDTGQASLSAPLSEKLNEWAKAAETTLGATPRDPEMFSPMEQAEITAAIGTQVALAFTGAEEVKVAMNVIGAIGGLRGVVESIRNDPNWATSSSFWGSLIGMGLSIVGLKHAMAASKITTLVLKFGWVAAAVPPLTRLAADYWYLETHPDLDVAERGKVEARIKQGWTAAVHVVKDAILHVAQSQGGKTAKPGGEEGVAPQQKAGSGSADDAGVIKAPLADDSRAALTTKANGSSADGAGKPAAPAATVAKAPAVSPANTPEQPKSNLVPLKRAQRPAVSAASKQLEAKLNRQSPAKAGSVTKLPAGKAGTPPGSEPMQQKIPEILAEPLKMAVGQTHGADGGQTPVGKPQLRMVGSAEGPVMSAKSGAPGKTGAGSPRPVATPGRNTVSPGASARASSKAASKSGKGSPKASAPVKAGKPPAKSPIAKPKSSKFTERPAPKLSPAKRKAIMADKAFGKEVDAAIDSARVDGSLVQGGETYHNNRAMKRLQAGQGARPTAPSRISPAAKVPKTRPTVGVHGAEVEGTVKQGKQALKKKGVSGVSEEVYGSLLHTELRRTAEAKLGRRLAPGAELFNDQSLAKIKQMSPAESKLSAADWLKSKGIPDPGLSPELAKQPIGTMKPDLVFREPGGAYQMIDLTGQPTPSHLAKSILYALVLSIP